MKWNSYKSEKCTDFSPIYFSPIYLSTAKETIRVWVLDYYTGGGNKMREGEWELLQAFRSNIK